jgi:hypothetical protein
VNFLLGSSPVTSQVLDVSRRSLAWGDLSRSFNPRERDAQSPRILLQREPDDGCPPTAIPRHTDLRNTAPWPPPPATTRQEPKVAGFPEWPAVLRAGAVPLRPSVQRRPPHDRPSPRTRPSWTPSDRHQHRRHLNQRGTRLQGRCLHRANSRGVGLFSAPSWSLSYSDHLDRNGACYRYTTQPTVLLRTLLDDGRYIEAVPKAKQEHDDSWRR